MNRQELSAYLADTYSVDDEQLFAKFPTFWRSGTMGTENGLPSSWTFPERIWVWRMTVKSVL